MTRSERERTTEKVDELLRIVGKYGPSAVPPSYLSPEDAALDAYIARLSSIR